MERTETKRAASLSDLRGRLLRDHDRDLERLVGAFSRGDVAMLDGGLGKHFAFASNPMDAWGDQPSVLAISIGGSTTKVAILHCESGQFVVEQLKVSPNPNPPEPWPQFFDRMLFEDEAFASSLRTGTWAVGISIAVLIIDGCPCHPSKLVELEGLCSPTMTPDPATHHLGENFSRYLGEGGVKLSSITYEGDGIVAHLGGVAVSNLEPDDHSILLVCGTGLATATRRCFVLCGMPLLLGRDTDDPVLHAPDVTEDGQFQYLIAGKGLFGLMHRALRAAAEHDGVLLSQASEWFASAGDSRLVIDAWADHCGQAGDLVSPRYRDVIGKLDSTGRQALGEIASTIMTRGVDALAACVAATLSQADREATTPATATKVFLEGSIARHPLVQLRLAETIARHQTDAPAYALHRMPQPTGRVDLLAPDPSQRAATDPSADGQLAGELDLSVIGAATLAWAAET